MRVRSKIKQYLGRECPYCSGEVLRKKKGRETEYLCRQCGRTMKKKANILEWDMLLRFVLPCQAFTVLLEHHTNHNRWIVFAIRLAISIPIFLIVAAVIHIVRYIFGNHKRIE